MNLKKPIEIISLTGLLLFCFCNSGILAQKSIHCSGGEASGTGGKASWSVGQIVFNNYSTSDGSVSEGVQQPYEISIITGIENPQIGLNIIAYPNPTFNNLELKIDSRETENMRYFLYDINGKLLDDKRLLCSNTLISLNKYYPGTYLLKIRNGKKEIKSFKIIKN